MNRSSTLTLFGLLLLAVVAAVLLFGRRDRMPPEAPVALETAQPVIAAVEPISRVTDDSKLGPLKLVDRLSGEELDLDAQIEQSSTDPVTIPSGTPVDLSTFEPAAEISPVDAAVPETVTTTIEESTEWTGDEWRAVIPYNSGLHVTLLGVPERAQSIYGEFFLLPSPETVPVEKVAESVPGPFAPDLEQMTPEGKVRWLARRGHLTPIYKENADHEFSAEMFEPLAGAFVVLWTDRRGNQAIAPVVLTPGQESYVTLHYSPRPVISGRLLDWNGDPVPHGQIKTIIQLDLANYDFLPQDPHAFGAINSDTVGLVHTIDQRYKADAEGRFSLTVPRGCAYALQSFEKGSYAYWSTVESGHVVEDQIQVDLVLAPPGDHASLLVTLQDPTGAPIADAEVFVALVEDLPFMRQWPEQKTSADGTTAFAGLEPGQHLAVVVLDSRLIKGIMVERIVLTERHELLLAIPQESFVAQ